jgi:tetratricopeptide (TPR) repeat protein
MRVATRLRVLLAVGAAAAAAAGATVGITLATRTPTPAAPTTTSAVRSGVPPLLLDLGVRTDPQAVALRRALTLYDAGHRSQARAIFARFGSPEAAVGASFSRWPAGFASLERLARRLPKNPAVLLNYGMALYWRGRLDAAETSWRSVRRDAPDTPYAVRAGDLLYPNYPAGLPSFVPSFPVPQSISRLSAPRQLATLAARARTGGEPDRLLYGVALQRLGRQVSALRQYEAAAAAAPGDPQPQVAAAVARFDKADPSATFSHLGPLAKKYPRSASVRFHLGLCLLWLGQVKAAEQQLQLARTEDTGGVLGAEAKLFLDRLAAIGTK